MEGLNKLKEEIRLLAEILEEKEKSFVVRNHAGVKILFYSIGCKIVKPSPTSPVNIPHDISDYSIKREILGLLRLSKKGDLTKGE